MNNTANEQLYLRDAEFKDAEPLKTVEKIKNILSSYNIETIETWHDTCVPYCFALSVKVNNSNFIVNGKGLTKSFALASAYGELMERLQLGYIGNRHVQKDGHYAAIKNPDILMPAKELYAESPDYYQHLAKKLQKYTGKEEDPETLLQNLADPNGQISVIPYYNVTKRKKTHYSTFIQMRVYTTTGCAAGNSLEEASVQAISEIVERNHHMCIVDNAICIPTIPDEHLKQYSISFSIIQYIRSCGYRVIVKDCSLGCGFPVVAVCMIDTKTGKYHTHFGAYPIFEIALERALTESFQGHNINNIAKSEDFNLKGSGIYSIENISLDLTTGCWNRHPGFFFGESDYTFCNEWFFRGKNNKELFRECIDFFSGQGYDVLIRDYSCLGFPSCQVIIPGYSEVYAYRLSPKLDDHKYAHLASGTLRNPSGAKVNEMMGLLMHIAQIQKYPKALADVHGFTAGSKLAATLTFHEQDLLMSATLGYVYYTLGKYKEAEQCAEKLVSASEHFDTEQLLCLKRYLSLSANHYDQTQTRQILEYFHKEETVASLFDCISENANPFDKYTLHCDLSCTENCPIYCKCYQKQYMGLVGLINKKLKELSFEDSVNYFQKLL